MINDRVPGVKEDIRTYGKCASICDLYGYFFSQKNAFYKHILRNW